MNSVSFSEWLLLFNLFIIAVNVNAVLHKLWELSGCAMLVVAYVGVIGVCLSLAIEGYIPPYLILIGVIIMVLHVYLRASIRVLIRGYKK